MANEFCPAYGVIILNGKWGGWGISCHIDYTGSAVPPPAHPSRDRLPAKRNKKTQPTWSIRGGGLVRFVGKAHFFVSRQSENPHSKKTFLCFGLCRRGNTKNTMFEVLASILGQDRGSVTVSRHIRFFYGTPISGSIFYIEFPRNWRVLFAHESAVFFPS